MKRITLKKRRNGCWSATGNTWHSMGTGASGTTGDDDSDDSDSEDEEEATDRKPKKTVQQLSREAARRRREARDWKQRAEAAEAKLAGDGKSSGMNDTTRADFLLALVEAGLKRDRIRAATKLIDLDEFEDVDEAIEELRAEHPFLFGSESGDDTGKTGRTAPSMNNGRKKLTRETSEQKASRLAKRFPALQGRVK